MWGSILATTSSFLQRLQKASRSTRWTTRIGHRITLVPIECIRQEKKLTGVFCQLFACFGR